jgi:predicted SnoaL-like aldol condensation-catalyzing enzyme
MPTNLLPDQMKRVVRDHFEEFVNKRNPAVIRTNMTSDFFDHDGPGGLSTDAAGDEKMMIGMFKIMPDLQVTIEEMVAENDKVVCRNIWRWIDPGSRKAMQMHGFVLWRFEGARIAERWATVTAPAEGSSWDKLPERRI